MGSGLAIYDGSFKLNIFILTLVTTLFLQILSNLANDYGDSQNGADNDARVGPKRAVQSQSITKEAMRRAILILVFLSLGAGIPLVWISTSTWNPIWLFSFLALGLLSVWAAIRYTSGSNPYGYRGLGDLFVFLFFGVVGVVGSYQLQAQNVLPILVDEMIYLAISVGLLSTAVLNLNNMRDLKSDQIAGKNTVALNLGFKKAKVYHLMIISIAILCFNIAIYRLDYTVFQVICCNLPTALFSVHLLKVIKVKEEKDYDPELKKVALATFAQAMIFIFFSVS